MAHYQQKQLVQICKKYLPEHFSNSKVLEVGSWDTNGTIRSFFNACEYYGVDISEGPGVDIVCRGQDIESPSNFYDTVISCECFEHNEFWRETFSNMLRVLKPGGLCIITCASIGRIEHGTQRSIPNFSLTSEALSSSFYYRNLDIDDFKKSGLLRSLSDYIYLKNIYSRDLYLVGFKKDCNSVGHKKILSHIVRDAQTIKTSKVLTPMEDLKEKILYTLLFVTAKLLGEDTFHNFRYRLTKMGIKVPRRISLMN